MIDLWLGRPVAATGVEDVFDVTHRRGVVEVDILTEDLLRGISVVGLRVVAGNAAGCAAGCAAISSVIPAHLLLNRLSL